MANEINTVAVHEAGHAVVLASLGYASEIEYVTASPNFVPSYLAALYEGLEKREGIKLPNFTEHSAGHIRRFINDEVALLPLEIEVPYCLAGAIAQRRYNPADTFSTLIAGGLGGDIESLVREFKRAGYEASSGEIFQEIAHLLFRQTDSRLPASSATTRGYSLALEALSGSRVLPNPRYDCLDAGCTLATEKITTHWNVVRELADQLVENDVLYSPDLLSLLGRHGLSGA